VTVASDEDKRVQALAVEAFAEHQLVERDDERGRWMIARRYEDGKLDGHYLTEVISLFGGRLFVGGDISDCTFGYYSSSLVGKDLHLAKLRWLGTHTDVSYYVAQKASIGMSDAGKLTEEYNSEVAEAQLKEHAEYLRENDGDADEIGVLEAAVDRDGWDRCTGTREELWEYLMSNRQYPPDLPDFGMVTAPRVIYAWAAMRRLCELLEEHQPKAVD
jgi:hypothetical protein